MIEEVKKMVALQKKFARLYNSDLRRIKMPTCWKCKRQFSIPHGHDAMEFGCPYGCEVEEDDEDEDYE